MAGGTGVFTSVAGPPSALRRRMKPRRNQPSSPRLSSKLEVFPALEFPGAHDLRHHVRGSTCLPFHELAQSLQGWFPLFVLGGMNDGVQNLIGGVGKFAGVVE